jgi:uncharacterized protein (TIGR02217 family)
MAFRDVLLDKAISFGAQGGPEWGPDAVAMTESGDESRENTKSMALGEWTISYNARRPAIWRRMQDFFYVIAQGRANTWPFYDWLDHDCLASESQLTVLTANTTWQMYKRRSLGGHTYDQKIVLPLVAQTTVAGGGNYSVARATGIITRNSGANPTGFVCREFHKLCRMDMTRLIQTFETTTERMVTRSDGSTERLLIVSYAGIPVKEIPLTSA